MKEIFDRKKELIKRDPLYEKLLKRLSCKDFNKKILEEIDGFGKPYPSMPAQELQIEACKRELAIQAHQKKFPDYWKFFQLTGEVNYKWHVLLELNQSLSIKPYTHDEPIWIGKPPFDTYTTHNASIHYPQLKWTPYPNPFKKELLADINEIVTPGYKGTPDAWLPIIINTSRLNKSDAKRIKRLLWEIIETRLQKGVDKTPYDEYPECAFIYKLRKEDTFQKYLKWYDLHMSNGLIKPKGLQFREIARMNLHDLIKKKCPNKLKTFEQKMNQMQHLTKALQKQIQKSTNEPIEWEDAIEKAVKTIYKAIHRKSYPAKTKQKLFNCPQHKKDCPIDCENLQKSMEIFNKRYTFRKHTTKNNVDHEPDPKEIQPPAKGKGTHIIGSAKYLEND